MDPTFLAIPGELMLILVFLCLVITGLLSLSYFNANKKFRIAAGRLLNRGDSLIRLWAIGFPFLASLIIPNLIALEKSVQAILVLLCTSVATGCIQRIAWKSWNGAGVLISGSILVAVVDYSILYLNWHANGSHSILVVICVLIASSTIWRLLLRWSLRIDKHRFQTNNRQHTPSNCLNCGYSLVGLTGDICPECGALVVHPLNGSKGTEKSIPAPEITS